jgi:hypothetical protein
VLRYERGGSFSHNVDGTEEQSKEEHTPTDNPYAVPSEIGRAEKEKNDEFDGFENDEMANWSI